MSEKTPQEGSFKVKLKKPKQLNNPAKTTKVDLSKPKEEKDAIQVTETKTVDVDQQTGDGKEVGSGRDDVAVVNVEKQPEETTDQPVIEEIIDEPVKKEEVVEKRTNKNKPINQQTRKT